MCAGIFSNLVFFLVCVSSCPTEVHLLFSFVSFSAAYFCLLLLCSPFLHLCSLISASCLFPLFLICLSVSSLLADGACTTFSYSALLSPLLDVSLCCGISQDLSLRDLVPLWDPPWCLPLLPLWNPCHPSTLFSLSVRFFPHWLFLWLKCISLHPSYRLLFCPAVDSDVLLSPFVSHTTRGGLGVKSFFSLPCRLFSVGCRCRGRAGWLSLWLCISPCASVSSKRLSVLFQ